MAPFFKENIMYLSIFTLIVSLHNLNTLSVNWNDESKSIIALNLSFKTLKLKKFQ